ncbi:MAG: hypothetical protein CMG00_06780 [Candidatus Marinimicrobia bacterium]|nr:hypothetical protein [Candidatus Neomarinimicrobiota bacterium]|tara:strand:+ start:448 stop:1149 length:702 start_codon:yes stop_codon:yes gene_type:complete
MKYRKHIIRFFWLIASFSFFTLIIIDYKNFSHSLKKKHKKSLIDKDFVSVFGNKYVPNDRILNIVQDSTKNFYNYLIKELKIIDVSNSKKLILVKEDAPRFIFKNIVYLESGNKVVNNRVDSLSLNIPYLRCIKNTSDLSDGVLSLTNYMASSFQGSYSEFSNIKYSSQNILSIVIDSCEVILMDSKNEKFNKHNILEKVRILKEFEQQSIFTFKELDKIDLRWRDKIFINKI